MTSIDGLFASTFYAVSIHTISTHSHHTASSRNCILYRSSSGPTALPAVDITHHCALTILVTSPKCLSALYQDPKMSR